MELIEFIELQGSKVAGWQGSKVAGWQGSNLSYLILIP